MERQIFRRVHNGTEQWCFKGSNVWMSLKIFNLLYNGVFGKKKPQPKKVAYA